MLISRTVFIFALVFFALTAVSTIAEEVKPNREPAGEPPSVELMQAILAELRALNANLAVMNDRMQALSERVEALEDVDKAGEAPPRWAPEPQFHRQGASWEKLKDIKLPEHPTREQVKQYINDIALASAGQNSFSSDDPQPRMLATVGREHLDLLVDQMGEHPLEFYVSMAISRLATEEDKQLVIDNLPVHQELAELVMNRGWVEDARDVLIEELKHNPRHLPTEWIDAVALLEDRSTYPHLKRYFINGSNRASTYRSIRRLPGIELDDAVEQAWKRARVDNEWSSMAMAEIAVEYGHVDALGMLIDALGNDDDQHVVRFPFGDGLRPLILRRIEFRGSDEEIQQWFKENQKKLQFDEKFGKYVVVPSLTFANDPSTPDRP